MSSVAASGPSFRHRTVDGCGRFWFVHRPPSSVAVRGAVLAVHPFAEELNKTRGAVADGARALAAAGFVVLLVDLAGCGDSAGDFADASWSAWLADLDDAWGWLADEAPAPRWLWGTRLGALLADDFAVVAQPPVDGLLFWQPVVNGAQHLGQFLRLKTAANLLRQAGAAASGLVTGEEASPRAELAAGKTVEIAGYRLTPGLADAVEGARLGAHIGNGASAHEAPVPPRVRWLEVSSLPTPSLGPLALRVVERWSAAGSDVASRIVAGPAFWQTQEVTRSAALVSATVEALVA